MQAKRYQIEETPDSMHQNQGVPRKDANVEAEKGETMITSNETSNVKRLVGIGGEKHSNGGTPLSVPGGTAIFSDKLKIKDPTLLKFFNESGKKAMTFADISKNYDTGTLHKQLEDENNDKITTESLQKSIDDANFKLSALFAVQEFHEKKGAPDQHSEHFETFMQQMGISYDDIFGTDTKEQVGNNPGFAPIGKMGLEIPKAVNGADLPQYEEKNAFSKQGVTWLNTFLSDYGIPLIDVNNYDRNTVLQRVKQAQMQAITENPDLVFDFMTTGDGQNKSHRPNIKLQGMMDAYKSKYTPTGEDGKWSNEDLKKMLDSGDITTEQVLEGYNDNKWWYRMVTDRIQKVTQEEYNKLLPRLNSSEAIKQGDYTYLYEGNGIYKAYTVDKDGNVQEVPDAPPIDDPYKWNINHMTETETPRNMDYRWDHLRALEQARKNKTAIPRLRPYTPFEDVNYADLAYYSPDQAIAAIQSMVGDQSQKVGMFAGPQSQLANVMAGQQFDVLAKTISDYEDKNVATYNQERLTNTEIANRHNARLADAIKGHHDATTILKQEYANARTNADNNIAENEIAAWNERRMRLNMEATIGEQFATDPMTGLHTFIKGKDFYPEKSAAKDVADTYLELQKKLPPDTPASEIADMAMAIHSGKYAVQRDNVPPNDSQYRY